MLYYLLFRLVLLLQEHHQQYRMARQAEGLQRTARQNKGRNGGVLQDIQARLLETPQFKGLAPSELTSVGTEHD